jgi:hypothetical protein
MKIKIQLIFIFWIFMALNACTQKAEVSPYEFNIKKISNLPEDIVVPSKVWDLLEFKEPNLNKSHAGTKAESHEESKSAIQSGEITGSEVNIYLYDKNPGVVIGSAVKIELPKGGGKIDLADYISDVSGSFYFRIEYPAFAGSSAQRVVFQSKARKRRLDEKLWGAGCDQILDITSLFLKTMSKDGLKVNSNRQRHVTVLGGTFFLSAKTEGGFSVAQVTIQDSKHQSLFCEAH